MEIVTILLVILPIAGFIMEKYGLGAYKRAESFVQDLSLEEAKTLMMYFSRLNSWHFKNEYDEEGKITMIFQVGQWGFSLYGAQAVIVVFTQAQGGVNMSADSTSMMGQVVDFGSNQKNLDKLHLFVTDAAVHKEEIAKYRNYGNLIQPNHFIINPLYWLFLWAAVFGVFLTYYFNYRDKQKAVPGNIIVAFRDGYTQEQEYTMLDQFGAGSCANHPAESMQQFLCAVPVGTEDQILGKARTNFAVQSATRWHGE